MLVSGNDVSNIKSIGQFLTLLIIFAIVLAITYFSTKFIADYQKGQINASNIKLHDAARLSQNKYIQIVEIGKKYFALAVCKDTVTVIAELNPEDLDFSKENGLSSGLDFSQILGKIKSQSEEVADEASKVRSDEEKK